ncbi:DJ-1/PfpI family protein [Breoghania sp.]|uniref:DJ-1/PfpI family protein n=1 Tax=Breoghania sp. TaxID=2065378 RepID=UPI0026375BF3|nr:DJ-1/PfpI family protein [Breoghania sp.]MDJ0933557.1 DJ-1/PfpI family protein [Breoghania sp.]
MVRPQVTVLAYDGVDELDLFGLYSVLAKARGRFDGLKLVPPDSPVTGSAGTEFVTEPANLTIADSDALVIPGGRRAADIAETRYFAPVIRHLHSRGARIYCCCSGTLILAAALKSTDGVSAIHHRKRDQLKSVFGGRIETGFVESNSIVSVGGQISRSVKSVDLAFRLLADVDPSLADRISDRMEIAWRTEP